MQWMSRTPWHALPVEKVLHALSARAEGLSEAEAAHRLKLHGANTLPEPGRPSLLGVALRQLFSPFVYILGFAAIVAIVLQDWSDAGFIVIVVLIDAGVGTAQEWQAETSAASLKKTLRISPSVIRGGVRKSLDIAELVPGDIVLLESGAAAPADLRLLSTHDLKVDQSLLTGESIAVHKNAQSPSPESAVLADRANMAHAGTMIVSGRGVGVVCATGADTELGAIARMLGARGARPPLLMRMETFSNRIAAAVLVLVVVVGLGQWARGEPLGEILLLTMALAVSAIPEGLPMAVTVALAVASTRMAKRGVIVRRLPAVEALGSCTLIATDKTGTLTVNRITAKQIVLATGAAFDIEGEGLELEGRVRAHGAVSSNDKERLLALARVAALANEGQVRSVDATVEAIGDPVDVACLVLATKLGAVRCEAEEEERKLLPYEPKRGYSAVLMGPSDSARIAAKGAPERVLEMCANVDRARADNEVHTLARSGYRVLAFAAGPAAGSDFAAGRIRELELLGFVGLIDPLREEAPGAVAEARAAGIDVRMITGDHPETALAIARMLDPARQPERVLTGAELNGLQGEARARAIRDAQVFARVEPAQKHLIVTQLQNQGHFVAVTGDGVNDAPALKAAHVGVAMGAGGTDVARAASDLIVTDDNFASIVAGVEEGRAAYDNIRKIVWFLLSTGVSEVLVFALAIAAGLPAPLRAVQILWLNLVTEGIQDVALSFEGKEPAAMARKPRSPKEPIFNRQMVEQCLVMGVYVGTAALFVFWWALSVLGYDEAAARNLVLLFLVSFNNFHMLNCRSETRSFFRIPLRANPLLIISILAAQAVHVTAMHVPILQNVLGVQPVSLAAWVGVIALAASVLVVGEAYKAIRARSSVAFAGRRQGV
jgi:magnesium-transporting ATPase (P-type)